MHKLMALAAKADPAVRRRLLLGRWMYVQGWLGSTLFAEAS